MITLLSQDCTEGNYQKMRNFLENVVLSHTVLFLGITYVSTQFIK